MGPEPGAGLAGGPWLRSAEPRGRPGPLAVQPGRPVCLPALTHPTLDSGLPTHRLELGPLSPGGHRPTPPGLDGSRGHPHPIPPSKWGRRKLSPRAGTSLPRELSVIYMLERISGLCRQRSPFRSGVLAGQGGAGHFPGRGPGGAWHRSPGFPGKLLEVLSPREGGGERAAGPASTPPPPGRLCPGACVAPAPAPLPPRSAQATL